MHIIHIYVERYIYIWVRAFRSYTALGRQYWFSYVWGLSVSVCIYILYVIFNRFRIERNMLTHFREAQFKAYYCLFIYYYIPYILFYCLTMPFILSDLNFILGTSVLEINCCIKYLTHFLCSFSRMNFIHILSKCFSEFRSILE